MQNKLDYKLQYYNTKKLWINIRELKHLVKLFWDRYKMLRAKRYIFRTL